MSEILLVRQERSRPTAERVRELLNYDRETGKFTWRVRRCKMPPGSTAGVRTTRGRWVISVDGRQFYAHHLAWLIVTGEWPVEIDQRAQQRMAEPAARR